MHPMRSTLVAGVLALAVAVPGFAGPASQRGTQSPPPAPAPGPQLPSGAQPINAGEIQRLFEAYEVLQAEEALQLNEGQYFKFVTRLKALQETRRAHLRAHNQILNELRKLTNPQTGSNDEMAIMDRLKALRDDDDRAVVDIRKASEGVDETLDARQQARFRIFEDRVEQQKLELLMRARQGARAAARGKKGGGL
jgi:hypothetical protein